MKNGNIFLHILCNMFVKLQYYQNYKSCAFVLYLALCKINLFLFKWTFCPINCRYHIYSKFSLLYLFVEFGVDWVGCISFGGKCSKILAIGIFFSQKWDLLKHAMSSYYLRSILLFLYFVLILVLLCNHD
jgi:hypothetical protein